MSVHEIDVTCSGCTDYICGAGEDQPCRGKDGNPVDWFHAERRDAARFVNECADRELGVRPDEHPEEMPTDKELLHALDMTGLL